MRGLGVALLSFGLLGATGAVSGEPAGAAEAPSAPRELLVRFEPGAAQARAVAAVGGQVVERLPLRGLVRVRLDERSSVAAADARLERREEVLYAQPNHRYRFFATPSDTRYAELWGLGRIAAPAAWDLTTGSASVTVAVVDNGVDYNHPDLRDNIWSNPGEAANGRDDDGNGLVDDTRGWDFLGDGGAAGPDNEPLDDPDGHGTHVAGTIGARGNNNTGITGVNWNVKLMPLRVGDLEGMYDSDIVSAFAYACAKGAKVVNGSFGGGEYSQALHDAIAACPRSLFVFAAGNGNVDSVGLNNDVSPAYPCNDWLVNVLCVAASGQTDALVDFSNYGPATVDLAAPGVEILSTVPGAAYDSYDGTSMAAPHVSGVAALVWARRPTLTVEEVRRAVLLSVDTNASLSGRVASGGRLNAYRALIQEVEPPVGLTAGSSTHQPSVWSNAQAFAVTWGGATDASGIDGYSYALSPAATFVPDEVKDAEESGTSAAFTVGDGVYWFHVRARDGVGNWSDAARFGPIMVDTFQPVRPVVSSPSHRVGGASADLTIDVAWSGSIDGLSGVDGYSFSWSQGRGEDADTTKDVEENVATTTSSSLAVGAWWFNIRATDNAGNWTETVSIGPFSLRTGPTACTVPRLRGLTYAAAKARLVKNGCAAGRITRTRSRRVARGRVVAQRPAPGRRLRRGARVSVVLSRGRR